MNPDDAGTVDAPPDVIPSEGCVPAPESCNEMDDDCDGVVDNGFDLTTDAENCGACGNACDGAPNASAACVDGTCRLVCADGFADCDADLSNGCEASLQTDDANCGMCGLSCDPVAGGSRSCNAGLCRLDCEATRGDCNGDPTDGCEIDLRDDTENCGMCDNRCMDTPGASRECSGGMCSFPCLDGRADCDADITNGCEVTLATDVDHCGMCGVQCRGDNAVMTCRDSDCEIQECLPTWGDCNEDVRDGCEERLATIYSCGTCGTECDEPAQHCDVGPASTVCAGADNLRQVALGKTHGCALDTAGRVYCWGKNNHGQSGYEPGSVGTTGSVENASLHQELANVLSTEGATATQLALGSEFSCALGSNGRVYCWGRNNTGQLGRNLLPSALASDPNPAAVSGLTDAIAVYAGGTRACAVRAGTATLGSRIVCWGDGRYLGLGSSVATDCGRGLTCSTTPIEVPDVIMAHRDLNAGSMSIGTYHMCAVDRLNSLFCWGLNSRGQVGVSTMVSERPPTSPFTTSVVSVAAGTEHTLVVLAGDSPSGNLMVFGRNNHGQLGLGPSSAGANVVRPSIIPGLLVSRLGSGYGIEAGKEHSCATTATGLQCWGRDDQGQLGNSSMFSSQTSPALVVPPSMTVGPYIGLRGLSLDEKSSCAISAAGALHCWGEGRDYRLGTGGTGDEQAPASVPGL